MFGSFGSILVFAAHPDDAEYGCGGLLASLPSARKVVVVATDGRDPRRVPELIQANSVLGCNVRRLKARESWLEHAYLLDRFDEALSEVNPDLVLAHWPDDTHQDHVTVGHAAMGALRAYRGTAMFYPMPSSIGFDPTVFSEVSSEAWERKVRAIKCHATQAEKPYFSDAAMDLDSRKWSVYYRGNPATRCEAFRLYRAVRSL